MESVQFGAGVDERLEIKKRRQNLNGDLLDCVVLSADQECVDRQLDVFAWISDTIAAVLMIEHRGSVALPQDFVRLAGQERPDPSAQPEPLLFSRSEWFLGVGEPASDKLAALSLAAFPVGALSLGECLWAFDIRQMLLCAEIGLGAPLVGYLAQSMSSPGQQIACAALEKPVVFRRGRQAGALVVVIEREQLHQDASDSLARNSSASATTVSQLSSAKLSGLSGMASSDAALCAAGICAVLRISKNSGSEILLCSNRMRTLGNSGLPEPFRAGFSSGDALGFASPFGLPESP